MQLAWRFTPFRHAKDINGEHDAPWYICPGTDSNHTYRTNKSIIHVEDTFINRGRIYIIILLIGSWPQPAFAYSGFVDGFRHIASFLGFSFITKHCETMHFLMQSAP